jgi:hypothetical protein
MRVICAHNHSLLWNELVLSQLRRLRHCCKLLMVEHLLLRYLLRLRKMLLHISLPQYNLLRDDICWQRPSHHILLTRYDRPRNLSRRLIATDRISQIILLLNRMLVCMLIVSRLVHDSLWMHLRACVPTGLLVGMLIWLAIVVELMS